MSPIAPPFVDINEISAPDNWFGSSKRPNWQVAVNKNGKCFKYGVILAYSRFWSPLSGGPLRAKSFTVFWPNWQTISFWRSWVQFEQKHPAHCRYGGCGPNWPLGQGQVTARTKILPFWCPKNGHCWPGSRRWLPLKQGVDSIFPNKWPSWPTLILDMGGYTQFQVYPNTFWGEKARY